MFFSIILTIIIFVFIINLTSDGIFGLWVAMGIIYVLHFNNKNAQIEKLRNDIELLKKQIGKTEKTSPQYEDVDIKKSASSNVAATVIKKEKTTKDITSVAKTTVMPKTTQATSKAITSERLQKETNSTFLGQNLIVWIAGFAAILGAFYLIRYSVEHGILGPRVRFALMTLFGLIMTFIGYKIYGQDDFANNKRIGQALTGSGLATLYFAAYAVSEIYHFTSQGVSFVWMCVVTGMAVIITLIRGGKPIVLLTMLGAFLTPALAGNQEPNPCFFSLYMLVFMGVFAWMAAKMMSIFLLVLAAIGLYLWSFYWLFFGYGAFISLWQMLLLIGTTAMFINTVSKIPNQQSGFLKVLAITFCFFFGFGYVLKMQMGLMEWAIIGMLTLGLAFLTLKDWKNYMPLLFGSVIIGLGIWTLSNSEKSLPVFAGYTAVCLLPIYLSLWFKSKPIFAGYTGIFTLMFYAVYCFLFNNGNMSAIIGLSGAVALLLPILKSKLDTKEMQQAAGIIILSAAIMTAIALGKLLSADILPMFAAAGVLMFAVIGKMCRANYMIVGWVMSYAWFVYLLLVPIVYALSFIFIGQANMNINTSLLTAANILSYGVLPLLCFGGAMLILPKGEPRNVMFFSTVFLCGGIVLALIAKVMGAIYNTSNYTPGFVIHAILTDLMIAAYWFMIKGKSGSVVLSGIGFWRLGLFGLLLLLKTSDLPISYMGAILSFGVPAGLFIWFAKLSHTEKSFFSICAAICSLYLVTLLVTICYSGGETVRLFTRHTVDSGLFAYSAGWMLLGICWLVAAKFVKGMTKPAFVLIYFVIAKVFLYDVAELSDFWRIISLFALAGCLLGIGHFHARFFNTNSASNS